MARAPIPFRYVVRGRNGLYQAIAHGWKSKSKPTPTAAAQELALKLGIPLGSLRKVNSTSVTKSSRFAGVYWHKSRLGWVQREASQTPSPPFLNVIGFKIGSVLNCLCAIV